MKKTLPVDVVVTGLGLITPIGLQVPKVWNNLVQGVSGIKSLKGKIHPETGTTYESIPSTIAATVNRTTSNGNWNDSTGDNHDIEIFNIKHWINNGVFNLLC